MHPLHSRSAALPGLVVLLAMGSTLVLLAPAPATGQTSPPVPGGELQILGAEGRQVGACPLKHTAVEARIAGYVARTQVRQTFHNPLDRKIEAVYVFPLPQDAAVDSMVMTVGNRRIVGQIKPRQEAREAYEAARAAGHVAGLLDQERPNIFTQSVANIEPGVEVVIEISYVETLKYEDGTFEFVFPMVVGPRYIPGQPTTTQGTGWSSDTDQVPDASRITPPVTPPGTRAGHDISLTVHLDAGLPIQDIESRLHKVAIERNGDSQATVTLAAGKEIPNKDFILRYRTATDAIGDTFLVHTDSRGTFFALVLQPPRRVLPSQAVPKEMIFVIDRSGSMSGFPIEKAKETMRLCIERMNPDDTFNLLSFSGGTGKCFEAPVANTEANRQAALKYLADLHGSGGTEMMPAIQEALARQDDPRRLRIVSFMTDGYIGNDMEIIAAVRKHAGQARVFAFGIGNGVNRFLLDGMAHAGRGEVEYVTLQSQGAGAAERFGQRIGSPVLTDIRIDWGDLPVSDVYPAGLPDLFASKPLMIHGRLTGQAKGRITLRGTTAAGPFERTIEVQPVEQGTHHEGLPSLWARAKVTHLMNQDLAALQRGRFPEDVQQQITALGVEFHLMTQFTSFVAIEEMTVTVGGEPTTVAVPVEMPEGVSYEGVFGERMAGKGTSLRERSMGRHFVGGMPAAAPTAGLRDTSMIPMQAAGRPGRADSTRNLRYQGQPAAMDELSAATQPQVITTQMALAKLAEPLRDLADKVARQGKNGTLKTAGLVVTNYQVDIMVYLRDTSAETLKALEALGFVKTGESKAIRLLIGTIDVRRLADLAKLSAVVRVTPVAGK